MGMASAIPMAMAASRAAIATGAHRRQCEPPGVDDPRPEPPQGGFLPPQRRVPSSPPKSVSCVVSTITSLTRCARLAPRACRTASSLARLFARIKSRLARLTVPISRSTSTPACSKQQGGTNLGDVVGMERRHDGAKARIGNHFSLGVVCLQAGILRIDLRLRLIECGARFEPCNHLEDIPAGMPARRSAISQTRSQREIQLSLRGQKVKARRQDADHGFWKARQRESAVLSREGRR